MKSHGAESAGGDGPKTPTTTARRTTTTTSQPTTTTTLPPTTTTAPPPPPTAAPVTTTTTRHAIGKIGETLSYSQPASGVVDYKCRFTTNFSDGTQYVTYQNVRNLGCGDGVTPEYPR